MGPLDHSRSPICVSIVRRAGPEGQLTHGSVVLGYLSRVPLVKPPSGIALEHVFSTARLDTYRNVKPTTDEALELYAWNAQVSASLLVPAHFAEVAVRNAAAEALTAVYGPDWPWSSVFELSLPDTSYGYSPRRDLRNTRKAHQTTGKVIADLKLVFWERLFTQRHDVRVWNTHLLAVFPDAPAGLSVGGLRKRLFDELKAMRVLRNRIAHHEPIFTRDLEADLSRMLDLVELRSRPTRLWLDELDDVSAVLAARP